MLYPKGNKSDINRDSIWRYMEDIDWTLNSNVSVNDFWSAVRFKKKAYSRGYSGALARSRNEPEDLVSPSLT